MLAHLGVSFSATLSFNLSGFFLCFDKHLCLGSLTKNLAINIKQKYAPTCKMLGLAELETEVS